jgi:predicted MFS family arabinose efflux permease
LTSDARRILLIRALRAFAYGFGSVLLGVSLEAAGFSGTQVGIILTATLVGSAALTALLGYVGDRIGRRTAHVGLSLLMAGAGTVFAVTDFFWALFLAALSGTVATAALESGPFVTLEQAIIPQTTPQEHRNRVFGIYNAVAAIAGSLGALSAGGPAFFRGFFPALPASQRWFLLYAALGIAAALLAARLSPRVESGQRLGGRAAPLAAPLRRSWRIVVGLSGLFALDAFGGGFVLQAFIVYWFRVRFDASPELLGLVFFGVGILQSASFLVAARLAGRIGLVNTMVFTHLPSNVLLAAIPFAPNLSLALALLLARFALSQMDVPARQSYVVAVVDPDERTAAASVTNATRTVAQAASPALAGAMLQSLALGAPFILAGTLKGIYDLALLAAFRNVKPKEET